MRKLIKTSSDINKLNNVKLQCKILDYLEDVVAQRNELKEEFRPENIVTDATT